jgi:hypothetical protein
VSMKSSNEKPGSSPKPKPGSNFVAIEAPIFQFWRYQCTTIAAVNRKT